MLTIAKLYSIIVYKESVCWGEKMSKTKNSYSSLSDNELAELVKGGDDNAFEELAIRYLRKINFIARKFSAEGYEQKDFVQEGLLGLLHSCKTFNSNGAASFKSYMSVVVEHRFISIIRRSNVQRAIPSSNLVQIEDLSKTVEDTAQNPEELLMCREHLNFLFSRLKAMLSKTEYNVLTLYCSGLSYKQIAEKLSVTPKTADNALQRVRKKICFRNMS